MKTHPSWNQMEHLPGPMPRREINLGLLRWSWSDSRWTRLLAAVKRFHKGTALRVQKATYGGGGLIERASGELLNFIKEGSTYSG